MKRGDVMIVVAIAAVSGLSWSASLARDDDQISANSFAAGHAWAQRTAAEPVACEEEVLARTGPGVDTLAWRQGCVAEAETDAVPAPPPPAGQPPAGPPPAGPPPAEIPSPGLPTPR